MHQLVIALLVLGILAVLLEMLAPGFDGFLFGIIGILALVAAGVLAVLFIPGGWFIVAGQVLVLSLMWHFVFAFIRKKQLQGKIIMDDTLAEDTPLFGDLSGIIGKEGVTVTMLRPYGEVDINGMRLQVTSNGPLLGLGVKVRVADVQQGNRVVVAAVDGN